MSEEKNRRRRRKLHEHGLHDDIRYRGPLSFQAFQILGWLCIVTTAVVMAMKLALRVNPDMAGRLGDIRNILGYVPAMSLPFLLIANYARILNNTEGYRKQLLRNGGVAIGIFLVFNAVFYHIVIGELKMLCTQPDQVMPLVQDLVRRVTHYGFKAFNIFVDLFLCTAFMFFLNYRPARFFTGKKVILFRLFAVLPVAYEVGSLMLKAACAQGRLAPPVWAFPLMTVKPPMTFVVFIILAIFVKTREVRYCRHGNTREDYQAFLQTNRNSWDFSVFLSVVMFIAGILDLVLLSYMMFKEAGSLEALEAIDFETIHPVALGLGIGDSMLLALVAPLMLLFSYTRQPKLNLGLLIPIAGVVLIVIVVLQSSYQIVKIANLPRVDFNAIIEDVKFFLMTMQ